VIAAAGRHDQPDGSAASATKMAMTVATLRSMAKTELARKAGQYFVVGGVSALIDWSFFALFLYTVDAHYLVAGTLSFVVATAVNYVLSIRYVFNSGGRSRRTEIALVYLASVVGIILNLAVLGTLIELFALHPMLAKVISTVSAFGWNFCARYFWIFER